MIHETTRVEPPVINMLPEVVTEDENFLVVNKPPFMIVIKHWFYFDIYMNFKYYHQLLLKNGDTVKCQISMSYKSFQE